MLIEGRAEAGVLDKSGCRLVLEPSGGVRHEYGMASSGCVEPAHSPTVMFTIGNCSLGRVLIAGTQAGVSAVLLDDQDSVLLEQLRNDFPRSELKEVSGKWQPWGDAVLSHLNAERAVSDLPLCLEGTPFQLRVWQALCEIPIGASRSYSEVASAIGSPGAVRAVGTACALNSLAVLVPCHRVVRADRSLGRYRWGIERKSLLLDREGRT